MPVGAPWPNVSPTTSTRCEAPPGLKEAIVAVVTLLALVFTAFCTVTDADALLTAIRSNSAAAQATREKTDFIEARQCKGNARPKPFVERELNLLDIDRYDR